MGRFETIGARVGSVVDAKKIQYGDSFNKSGEVLKILYPNGVPPDAYIDLLTIARILDKLFRVATAAGRPDAANEAPWFDIAGYALLALARSESQIKVGELTVGGHVESMFIR